MQTHDLPFSNRLYWGWLKRPLEMTAQLDRVEPAQTKEIEHPHRKGVGFSIRIFGRLNLVVGQWVGQATTDEEITEHLTKAVSSSAYGIVDPSDDEMAQLGYDAEGEAMRPIGEW